MTRIESENKKSGELGEMQSEIEQLKKQLKHKQSKKFFNCGSCSVLLILIFLGLVIVAALILAKSGLWQIPFLTNYFYREPVPVYQVKNLEFNDNDLIGRIKAAAVSEALKQKKTANLAVSFELNEEELSSLLRMQVQKNKDLAGQVQYMQIALTPDSAQLFLHVNNPKGLIATVDFVPSLTEGKLNFQVKSFKVGNLELPRFFGTLFVENIGANTLNTLLTSLSLVGRIEEINLGDHKAQIKLIIANLNF
jgi:hypothetical protein